METQDEILIVGESVQVIQRKITRAVALGDFIREIKAQGSQTTPILPQGCRFYSQGEGGTAFIVEQAPQVRTIQWALESEPTTWTLAFPFVVFKVCFNTNQAFINAWLYYSNRGIQSESSELCVSNLANVYYPHNRICTGDLVLAETSTTLAAKVDDFIGQFWQTSFNQDLPQNFRNGARLDRRISTLARWQEATRENPLFPLEIPWVKALTVGQLLEQNDG